MKPSLKLTITVLFLGLCACAQHDNELATMFEADQAARRGGDIDWAVVNAQDAERRSAVMRILVAGEVRTAQDYYNAAMIFQHGGSEEDIRLAHAFATIASALSDSAGSNWLKAASWDRLMLRFEQPQWYGTQYVSDDSGRWTLYEVEPGAITDQQRAAWSVPPLAEAIARVGQMNGER